MCFMPARCSAIGLFSERAYCRFLCPLGGVLAFLDRLHLIDLLKRRPECGNPCHLCERSCPVRAIEKSGKIITAECFQCLDCQVEYYDDKRCPPLVQAAKRRDDPRWPAPCLPPRWRGMHETRPTKGGRVKGSRTNGSRLAQPIEETDRK